jgi:hypothetical protein
MAKSFKTIEIVFCDFTYFKTDCQTPLPTWLTSNKPGSRVKTYHRHGTITQENGLIVHSYFELGQEAFEREQRLEAFNPISGL